MLKQHDVLDRTFHALSDPSRRAMLERLSRGPASVTDLAKPLAMSLAAVVQHLQVLEAGGLVRSEKIGRVRTCHLEASMLETAESWITQRRSNWERQLDLLGDFLSSEKVTVHQDSEKTTKSTIKKTKETR